MLAPWTTSGRPLPEAPLFTESLIILALVLLNGVFSGAEIAVLSLRKTRIAELLDAGGHRARALARLRDTPESFLATVQIGITVIGATAAAFGGASLAAELSPVLAKSPVIAPYAHNLAVAVVVVSISFFTLVLGELVPKSLALRAGESYALLIAPPLLALAWAARPVVALLTGSSNLVLRMFGDRTTFTETRHSRAEVQQIVEEAASAGSVDPQAGEIASRALDFSNLDAYTVMAPRSEIVAVSLSASMVDIATLARASGHARVPVYEGATDNFVGFVNLRDVLAEALLHPEVTLSALLHPVSFVPDSMPAPALLRKLQHDRTHLALVSDEQGTVIGLVTIEDLVEELVGEIFSENDKPRSNIEPEGEGVWLVTGNVPLHELGRELGVELPEGDFATVAGLCLHLAGAIPPVGAALVVEGGISLEVVEATPRRVKRVRVRRRRALASAEAGGQENPE